MIWLSVLITIVLLWVFQFVFPDAILLKCLITSMFTDMVAIVCFVVCRCHGLALDDLLVIRGTGKHFVRRLQRLLVVGTTALVSAWWFYEKLDVSSIAFFGGPIDLGVFFIPFFVLLSRFSFTRVKCH